MTNEDLHHRIESDFTYHAPDDDHRRLHETIRNELRRVAHDLVDLLPECRERSLAITNLEQTMMWANAAIARSDNVPKFTNAPPINAPEDVITQANIRTRYRWLVRRVGRGFHPDTRGDEYTSLPDGLTPDDVDQRVAEMREVGDPYAEALDALGIAGD